MHTQIYKNILKVNRATPNNSCRAELGQYPLLINMQRELWNSTSTWNAVIRALTRLKPCSWRSRICRRVHFYSWYSHYTQTSTAQSGPNKSHSYKNNTTLPIEKMPLKYKRRWSCIYTWKETTNQQNTWAECKSSQIKKDTNKIQTEWSLSGYRERTAQTKMTAMRSCSLCLQKEVETEEHYLLHYDYDHIRAAYFPKFQQIKPHFMALPNAEKFIHLFGENSKMNNSSKICISQSQTKTVSQSPKTGICEETRSHSEFKDFSLGM